MNKILPVLQSHPFRARQILSVHRHLKNYLFDCARLLQSLGAEERVFSPGGAKCPPPLAQRPRSPAEFLLSALGEAENFLLARGVRKPLIYASFRSPRARVLESCSFNIGSLLRLPRVVRDEGSNTHETKLPDEDTAVDLFIYPDIQTYATAGALAKLFGTRILGKAYFVDTHINEKLDLTDAGQLPRRFTNFTPTRQGRGAMLVKLG